jgi:hypothetical protein
MVPIRAVVLLQCFGSVSRICGLNADPDPKPIRIQGFDDKIWKKFTAEKKYIFLDQNYNLLIARPP